MKHLNCCNPNIDDCSWSTKWNQSSRWDQRWRNECNLDRDEKPRDTFDEPKTYTNWIKSSTKCFQNYNVSFWDIDMLRFLWMPTATKTNWNRQFRFKFQDNLWRRKLLIAFLCRFITSVSQERLLTDERKHYRLSRIKLFRYHFRDVLFTILVSSLLSRVFW